MHFHTVEAQLEQGKLSLSFQREMLSGSILDDKKGRDILIGQRVAYNSVL